MCTMTASRDQIAIRRIRMKRLARIAMVALPLMTLAAVPAYADVKTRDRSNIKFEGMLGRMFNLFGGKAAKEGVEGLTAVKGSRKATINDSTGHIVHLSEEKVYDPDMKKKTEAAAMSARQMAAVLAMFRLVGKAMARMQKDGDKLTGTPLDTTTTFESVMSKDQLTQAQASSSSSGSSGGGIGGLLAKKIMKKEEPKARSTIFTMHHEVLEVSTSVVPPDVAIPADFKEKR